MIKFNIKACILFISYCLLLTACKKDVLLADAPYPDGVVPEYKFDTDRPVPNIASAETLITFKINGLKEQQGKFKFYIANVEAEVTQVTDTEVIVKVPPTAISGNASIVLDNKIYYGPVITIINNLQLDPAFDAAAARSIGAIYGILPRDNSNYYIFGSFNNYAGIGTSTNPVRGIVAIDANGRYAPSTTNLVRAFQGGVNDVVKLVSGSYLVGGGFTAFDTIPNVNGLARITSTGSLETTVVDVVNPDPVGDPGASKDTVSAVNGGISGAGISKLFETNDGKYIIIGNFEGYKTTYYDFSTKTSPYYDQILGTGIFRLTANGTFDSTFNYNTTTKRGYAGPNGFILDAIQIPGGDILMVGNFTSYNGKTTNRIVRIKAADGTVDPLFNGSANNIISTINYNTSTGKILIGGLFSSYNGVAANGVVMIKPDGSIDPSFNFKTTEGGIVNYVSQINYKGLIFVSGAFTHYNGRVRPGMAVLNPDGTLAAGYNNFGLFSGRLYDIAERTSDSGLPELFIVGSFSRFDGKEVFNIAKLTFKN